MSRKSLTNLAVFPIAAAALVACGSETTAGPRGSADIASPSYFYEQVNQVQALELNVLEPENLAAALPNRPALPGVIASAFTDSVAVGTVESVEPGVGYIYSDAGEESQETSFDDVAADGRDVVVRVAVEDAVGLGEENTVEFRMGVLLNADPATFMASLRGLDRVAVLLDRIPDGGHAGEFYPIMSGAGLAQVDEKESLVFAGLGDEGKTFMGAIGTAPALITAASGT